MYIVYLHGFLSSPNSQKGQILKSYLEDKKEVFCAPSFPDTPKEAYDTLLDYFSHLKKDGKDICIVGSSMGGFLATAMQIKFGFKIAVFNPCVHPQIYLNSLIGLQCNPYTGNNFEIKADMLGFLKQKDEENLAFIKNKTYVFLQTGDETLDYKYALDFYQGAEFKVSEGGCHAYTGFDKELDIVLDFFKS